MAKRVAIELDGNLAADGFRVRLAIAAGSEPNAPILLERSGYLPAAADLAQATCTHWHRTYRALDAAHPRQLKPKQIRIGSQRERAAACHDSSQTLREQFASWLQADSFRELDRCLREELQRDEAVQVLIRSGDRQLWQLPWHLWDLVERYPRAEIALGSLDYRVVPPRSAPTAQRVRILGILGYSAGLDVSADRQLLEQLPHAEVKILVEPALVELSDRLWEQAWDIIFFAGHGETDEAGEGRIWLSETESISIDRIWYGLRKAVERGLQLAMFNSCEGLGLLARQLQDDWQIPQMIVMRDRVPDRVAQAFLNYFLTEFASGQPLYEAARAARERLQGLETDYPCASWLPVIWQNPSAIPLSWPELRAEPTPATPAMPQQRLRLPRRAAFWFLTVIASSLLLSQPAAALLNQLGMAQHRRGKLVQARLLYQAATLVNPFKSEPHFNLGRLCEKFEHDLDCARAKYGKTAQLGLAEGYAQLARVQIQQQDLPEALQSTWHCLQIVEYGSTRAACLKNQGWIFWQQGRSGEAERVLGEAIALRDASPHAHCLLAQLHEARGEADSAREHWLKVQEFADVDMPEESDCLGLAGDRLASS